jgi:hypothetical protein
MPGRGSGASGSGRRHRRPAGAAVFLASRASDFVTGVRSRGRWRLRDRGSPPARVTPAHALATSAISPATRRSRLARIRPKVERQRGGWESRPSRKPPDRPSPPLGRRGRVVGALEPLAAWSALALAGSRPVILRPRALTALPGAVAAVRRRGRVGKGRRGRCERERARERETRESPLHRLTSFSLAEGAGCPRRGEASSAARGPPRRSAVGAIPHSDVSCARVLLLPCSHVNRPITHLRPAILVPNPIRTRPPHGVTPRPELRA